MSQLVTNPQVRVHFPPHYSTVANEEEKRVRKTLPLEWGARATKSLDGRQEGATLLKTQTCAFLSDKNGSSHLLLARGLPVPSE